MVQTRSRSRLVQQNSATVVMEGPTEQPSTSQKPKRKKNNHNNDDDATATINPVIIAASSHTQSTTDSFICQSMDVPTTSSTPRPEEKNNEKKKWVHQSAPSPGFPLPDLSIVLSLEAADDVSENADKEDEQLNTSFFVRESSDSEDETFDTNLHLQQQLLIDAFIREEAEQQDFQLADINAGAHTSVTTLSQSSNSWPIENGELQWTKTKKGKDCLIIGNFSYIYMSESQNKNILNLRCQRRDTKCGAVVHLDLTTRSFIDTNNVHHNHPPDRFVMKQKILNQKIGDRVDAEPTAILKIVERVYAEANLTDEEQLNIRLPRLAGKS